jgi:signal transduction histidine kinase
VLLGELLSNLLDNAIRYTPEGGVITVQVRRTRDGAITMAVRDTGPGEADDEAGKEIDPFYRGRDATAPGTGLGLAIVRTIATAHGASVRLVRNPGGRGLCIAATFPAMVEAYA